MGKETRPHTLDSALIERWAAAYLERFPSSAANLRRVLLRRVHRLDVDGESERAAAAAIDALIARYRQAGVIDDVAYAAARARTRLRRGQSLRTIRAGLAAKGVADADREAALAALDGADPELAAACAFARRRHLGPFRTAAVDRERELAAFARAGFSRHVAETVLACADADAVAAMLRGEC